jgi:hypothetical protein
MPAVIISLNLCIKEVPKIKGNRSQVQGSTFRVKDKEAISQVPAKPKVNSDPMNRALHGVISFFFGVFMSG